ncbi:MAG: CDP-diacylglycerol--glycerol-3-phosphate 3-phosphatidyltransferase [Verrucomicrobiae bacterium]|jgi:CDP-diacylglycerol--glycerol-3-phosphate 3-phosphatidyltransferase|nr:CDP-diacylglycerol--glycerol-3-phosphate 3-phosphatidyltransferase [Verrucomicrobiae bacterium]
MNLPNKLTVSRLVLTLFFLVAVFRSFEWHNTVALVLFLVASITDFFDGQIARARKLITNFGILMDPLADKILTCSAFIALVERGVIEPKVGVQVHAWMVCVIVARELAITGLRMMAASKNLVLAAEGYGKHKTISQMMCLTAMLVLVCLPEWGSTGVALFGTWLPWFCVVSIWITVLLTLFSGCMYLWNNRSLFLDDL